jgi:hypothetical protein
MENVIIIGILVLILGGAAFYIYKAKKSGKKCIGCPNGSTCSGHCGSCGCGCQDKT